MCCTRAGSTGDMAFLLWLIAVVLVVAGIVAIVRGSVLDANALYGDPTTGYEMDETASIDIDTPDDLRFADHLLRTGYL